MQIMGILNVTPDSFSDGGCFLEKESAITHALALEEEGADIIDIGGESSRPGSEPVSPVEEMDRVLPVIEGIRKHSSIPLSIDTTKAIVAAKALEAGANFINDISAGTFDPEMFSVAARSKVPLCLMHMRGTPKNMQENPHYENVVAEVCAFLKERIDVAISAGIPKENIWIDPGIGFGKRLEDNLHLLTSIPSLRALEVKTLIGTSRKSFIGRLLGDPCLRRDDRIGQDRLEGSLASLVRPILDGVDMVRVHDVRATKRFLTVLSV